MSGCLADTSGTRPVYFHAINSTWCLLYPDPSGQLNLHPTLPILVQVLLRALRDFNLGKLTADDTGIFMGLLNDLFPKTVELVPRAIDREFEAKVSICIGMYCFDITFPGAVSHLTAVESAYLLQNIYAAVLLPALCPPRPPVGNTQLELCTLPSLSHR